MIGGMSADPPNASLLGRSDAAVLARRRAAVCELGAFLDWWLALGPEPGREALDPAALGRWLSRTILLRRSGPRDLVYRIAGEEVQRFYNRNPTGESIWAVSQRDPRRHRAADMFVAMLDHRLPVVSLARHVSIDGYPREAWACLVPFFGADAAPDSPAPDSADPDSAAPDSAAVPGSGRPQVQFLLGLMHFLVDPPGVDDLTLHCRPLADRAELEAFCAAHLHEGLETS